MRASKILALLACLAASGVHAGPDAHDPAALNESAVEAIRQGDLDTAWILLERAARVAPYDPRIARNLRVLNAHRSGTALPEEPAAPQARPAPQARAPRVPPEPPAIWPPKP